MAEPTSKFTEQTQYFIKKYASEAKTVANEIGVSLNSLIGAVANEYDVGVNPNLFFDTRGILTQHIMDRIALRYDNDSIVENYNNIKSGDSSWLGKFGDPTTIDVGPGNIRIETAIDLLKDYINDHPGSNNDPLKLKQYDGHYDKLVSDLANFDNTRATLVFAGLKVKGADAYYKSKDADAWARASNDAKDALRVMYYKIKPDTLSSNIAESKRKAEQRGEVYNFNPYGDGGEQHLNNLTELYNAIDDGLNGRIGTPPSVFTPPAQKNSSPCAACHAAGRRTTRESDQVRCDHRMKAVAETSWIDPKAACNKRPCWFFANDIPCHVLN